MTSYAVSEGASLQQMAGTLTMRDPHFAMLGVADEAFSSSAAELANDADHHKEGDDRSSSLSEIEDRLGNEELGFGQSKPTEESDVNDTEAETERLENSPQKLRKHQSVVLTASNDIYNDSTSVLTDGIPVIENMKSSQPASVLMNGDNSVGVVKVDVDGMDLVSEMSSLDDSSEEPTRSVSPLQVSKQKRKRSSSRDDVGNHQKAKGEPTVKITRVLEDDAYGGVKMADLEGDISQMVVSDEQEIVGSEGRFFYGQAGETNAQQQSSGKQKTKKGKRKSKKIRDEDGGKPTIRARDQQSTEHLLEHSGILEAVDSNGEDEEMEDGAEADVSTRNDEGHIRKKTAMDSLGAIEQCFATLRDKLFDERLAQYNDELAMLTQPTPTHPEYLAMMECIDQRRDEKIQYEQTLLHYKLIALQKKSIADRAQHHSQYMQTVRDVRDRHLEAVSKQWYQVQRERRSWEGDVPDYMYTFPTRRSQQITNQTAYNTEVSILSGVAKHVGFPAAPDISGARSSEIDDDFQNMGMKIQIQPVIHHHQPPPGASKPTVARFSRPKPAIEEQFLERNPWANPQHPTHHHPNHQLQRHTSGYPHPATSMTTPVAQKRVVDVSVPKSSASTIDEARSGPSSSLAPTPFTADRGTKPSQPMPIEALEMLPSYTPSKDNEVPEQRNRSSGARPSDSELAPRPDVTESMQLLMASTDPSHELQEADDPISKPSIKGLDSTVPSVPNVIPSSPVNFSSVKPENPTNASFQSPSSRGYKTSPAAGIAMKGQIDWLGA